MKRMIAAWSIASGLVALSSPAIAAANIAISTGESQAKRCPPQLSASSNGTTEVR